MLAAFGEVGLAVGEKFSAEGSVVGNEDADGDDGIVGLAGLLAVGEKFSAEGSLVGNEDADGDDGIVELAAPLPVSGYALSYIA